MNNGYTKDLVLQSLNTIIKDGLNQMGSQTFSNEMYMQWVYYSQKMLEVSTRAYNPTILLNYLRVLSNISPTLDPKQKIGICLEYLIGVLKII